MLTVLKWIGALLLGLGVVVLLVLGISWALPIPAAERAALDAMETPAALRPANDNAFAAVWLLPYDGIDASARDALLADDVQRFQANPEEPASLISHADGRFARAEWAPWCRNADPCLAQVRAVPDAVAAGHAGHEGLHARIAEISRYRYYRSAFEPDPRMPFPALGLLFDRLSAHALLHVQGESGAALAGLCQDVSSARMLMAEGDTLVVAMVGGAWASRGAQLFTDILAEPPADVEVPTGCTQAFAPPRLAELNLCHAMRGEFAFQQAAMATVPPGQQLFLNQRKTLARSAWLLSRTCADDVQAQIRDDRRVILPPPPPVWTWHCAANAVGCVLVDIAGPAYDEYPQRMQDVGAQLRMAGAMLWLRGQPQGEASEVLKAVPEGFASAQRPLRISEDGTRVRVPRLGKPRDGSGPEISAPLPRGW